MQSAANLEPGGEYNAKALANGWAGLCDSTLAFQRPELAALLAIWREKAAGCIAPRREELSPKLLKAHLPNIAIYERVIGESGERRYRVRLMGTQFAQVMGNLTNKFIDEAVPAQFLSRWYAALDAVLEAGVPLRFLSRSDTNNKSYLIGEYLEAPLLAPDGSLSIVFAAGIYAPANSWAASSDKLPLARAG
jgi:hypothetical protein